MGSSSCADHSRSRSRPVQLHQMGACARLAYLHAEQIVTIRFSHHGQRKQLLQLPCSRLTELQQLYVDSMTVRLLEIPEDGKPSTLVIESDCSAFSSSCVITGPPMAGSSAGSTAAAEAAAPTAASNSRTAGIAGGSAGPTAGVALLPQLQHLEVFSCSIALEHLDHFSKVTRLTSLNLYNTTVTQDTSSLAPAAEEDLRSAMTYGLQCLTNLEELNIGLMGMLSPSALSFISRMQRLKRLQLYISTDMEHTDSFLASLPASLTAIELQDMCLTPGPAVAQQLSRLTQLQQLKLTELDLEPPLLASWTALTSLTLDAVHLAAPLFPAGVCIVSLSTLLQIGGFNNGAKCLFTALRQLPRLQQLELSRMQLDEVQDTQQLSALTASSVLTSLHLLARFSMPIPKGALQYVLPHGKLLAQLRVLRLQGGDGVSEEQCLDMADLARIAASCPGLTDLTLKGVISLGPSLAPLLKLQGSLQRLSVAGAAFGDAAAALVAQLTGLQSLEWSDCGSLTDAGLVRLSALKGLQRLYLKSCKGLSGAILPPDTWYTASKLLLESNASEAEPSDVWRQLLQLCEAAHAQQEMA